MKDMQSLILTLLLAVLLIPQPAEAASFQQWLGSFKQEAVQKGISRKTVDEALAGAQFLPRVIELDRKQPESKLTFAEYRQKVISQNRIDEGRRLLSKHREELRKASDHYGVSPEIIVALWGMETSYGDNTGGFDVISALATLAYEGRRADFFKGELIKALKIIDDGHITANAMKGSWAGAMGQNQFMPSSFEHFAVDGNKDGRTDIWNTLPDVFSSTANYLAENGWRKTGSWGQAVKVPQGFPKSLTGLDAQKSLQQWKGMGITGTDGKSLPSSSTTYASLVLPDENGKEGFLVYDNYRVLMKWNKSVYFASSVGILADAIKQ